MLLENHFEVPLPADQVWLALLDVERTVLCLPGASLDAMDGEEFVGTVRVKVGPVALKFKGNARFADVDHAARRGVLEASGKEIGGNGTAKATLTMQVHDSDGGSEVELKTDLAITGKAAKFGRGMIADVAGRLVDQFAASLTSILAGSNGTADDDLGGIGDGSDSRPNHAPAGAPAFQLLTWPPGPSTAWMQDKAHPMLKSVVIPALAFMLLVVVRRKRHSRRATIDGGMSCR